VLLLCYVCSYAALSAWGTYEPAAIGLNGVKWYRWAPAGFVKDYRLRRGFYYAYMPLYLADRWLWHEDDEVYSGKYPFHTPKDISDVYKAWE
jgi:hypothetical protein